MLAHQITRRALLKNTTGLLAASTIGAVALSQRATAVQAAEDVPLTKVRAMAGKNLVNWHAVLGDAHYEGQRQPAPNVNDIGIIDYPNYSMISANVTPRDIVTHNITHLRVRDATAFDYWHQCGYQFRVPYPLSKTIPSAGVQTITEFAETVEGAFFCWDGAGTQDPNEKPYDYGLGYQIILNPFDDFRGPKYLFGIALSFAEELDNGQISEALRGQFTAYELPEGTSVVVKRPGNEWCLVHNGMIIYLIYNQNENLTINRPRQWGRVNLWNGDNGWLDTYLTVELDGEREWHTVDLVVGFKDKITTLAIDDVIYPAVLSRTTKRSWGQEVDARLQIETVSKHPLPEGIIATSKIEVKDWYWNWYMREPYVLHIPVIQASPNPRESSRILSPVPEQTITSPFMVTWEEDVEMTVQIYQNGELIGEYPAQRSGAQFEAPLGRIQIKIWRTGAGVPDDDVWCEVVKRDETMIRAV